MGPTQTSVPTQAKMCIIKKQPFVALVLIRDLFVYPVVTVS